MRERSIDEQSASDGLHLTRSLRSLAEAILFARKLGGGDFLRALDGSYIDQRELKQRIVYLEEQLETKEEVSKLSQALNAGPSGVKAQTASDNVTRNTQGKLHRRNRAALHLCTHTDRIV